MKQRIKKSPDLADSLTYAVEMLRKAGLEFTFEEEQAESLDILEIKDWEERLIYSKHNAEEQVENDEWGYGGKSCDEDVF